MLDAMDLEDKSVASEAVFTLIEQEEWEQKIVWDVDDSQISKARAAIDMIRPRLQTELEEISQIFEEPNLALLAKNVSPTNFDDDFDNSSHVHEQRELFEDHPIVNFKLKCPSVAKSSKSVPVTRWLYPLPGFFFNKVPDSQTHMDDLKPHPTFGDIVKDHLHKKQTLLNKDRDVLHRFNKDLSSMDWMLSVIWEDEKQSIMNQQLIVDLNDDEMLFDDENFPDDSTAVIDDANEQNRFNVSCDNSRLYQEEYLEGFVGRTEVHHATFALDVLPPAFKLSLSPYELMHFHRPVVSVDVIAGAIRIPTRSKITKIQDLVVKGKKVIPKKEKELSCREGSIVLVEYIEEHPPVLMNVGMASEILVYYRKKSSYDEYIPKKPYGVPSIISHEADEETQFLGRLNPGQEISSVNNNLYTAPIFEHKIYDSDFLLVRSRDKAYSYLSTFSHVFVAGQLHPKVEVPAPGSRAAANFTKARITAFVLRELKTNAIVRLNDVMDAFPAQSEAVLRQRLKAVAEFQRGGPFSGAWKVRDDFQLPSLLDIQDIVKPEDVCAYECMEAHEYFLQKLGLEKLNFSAVQQLSALVAQLSDRLPYKEVAKYIDECLCLAPWNMTANFTLVSEGKAILQLTGPGNPLGRGEGFSLMRTIHRPEQDTTISRPSGPRSLTGTDMDLRKLEIKQLRQFLAEFGVPESTILSLGRWDLVGLLREKASEATRSGQGIQFQKFARSERNTYQSLRAQFKKDAQRVFERHCQVLEDSNPPSFDSKNELDNTDDELDDVARGLDMIMDADESKEDVGGAVDLFSRSTSNIPTLQDSTLTSPSGLFVATEDPKPRFWKKIKRTVIKRVTIFFKEDGTEVEEIRYIDDPDLVSALQEDKLDGGKRFDSLLQLKGSTVEVTTTVQPLKRGGRYIRSSKRKTIIPKKSKQGRKLFKKEGSSSVSAKSKPSKERSSAAPPENSYPPMPLDPKKKVINLTCGACGQRGHTRQNKRCPARVAQAAAEAAVTPSSRLESSASHSDVSLSQSSFSSFPAPDVQSSTSSSAGFILKIAPPNGSPPAPLVLKITDHGEKPKSSSQAPSRRQSTSSRKRKSISQEIDPVKKPKVEQVTSVRARGDPVIKFNTILANIIEQLSRMESSFLFRKRVEERYAPGYYSIVKNPMYLELLKQRCSSNHYSCMENFSSDLDLLVKNSESYNGASNQITDQAREVVSAAKKALELNKTILTELEPEITEQSTKTLLMSKLDFVYLKVWKLGVAKVFRFPVSPVQFPDYSSKISNPICLSTIKSKIDSREYNSPADFVSDLRLMWSNAFLYNGPKHWVTNYAEEIFTTAAEQLCELFPDEDLGPMKIDEENLLVTIAASRTPHS